jgi:hypothetical protein
VPPAKFASLKIVSLYLVLGSCPAPAQRLLHGAPQPPPPLRCPSQAAGVVACACPTRAFAPAGAPPARNLGSRRLALLDVASAGNSTAFQLGPYHWAGHFQESRVHLGRQHRDTPVCPCHPAGAAETGARPPPSAPSSKNGPGRPHCYRALPRLFERRACAQARLVPPPLEAGSRVRSRRSAYTQAAFERARACGPKQGVCWWHQPPQG